MTEHFAVEHCESLSKRLELLGGIVESPQSLRERLAILAEQSPAGAPGAPEVPGNTRAIEERVDPPRELGIVPKG